MRMQELLAGAPSARPRFLHLSFRHRWDVYAGQPYLATVPRLAIMDMGVHLFDLLRLFWASRGDHLRGPAPQP
jgi:predicted dehydrogenase